VTRNFLKELGVSESDINAYIAGPGFIAWFAMNNLEGWGGTINSASTGVNMNGNPEWWYTRQEQLCKNMLQRMRELGMQPVIPGFSGQIPNSLSNYTISGFSSSDVINGGTWAGGYTRPDILHPNSSSYATLAPIYYKHLEAIMGVSEFYSMDPFHEGGLPGNVTNATCYPPIMAALDTYHNAVDDATKTSYKVSTEDNQAKWIIQYWQNIPQSGAFSAMSSYGDRFIGLDLFSDNIYAGNAAKWRDTGNACYYQGRPYIYCMLHNFGGRSGLHGRLETTMDGYFQALANNNNCQGIGATPEGTETNPILYDMLFELPWMDVNNRPTADEWLAEYAHSRYGVSATDAPNGLAALKNLKKSVWDCRVNQQGTSEAVILARPAWTVNNVSSWSTSAIYWDTQDVRLAADQLISISDLVTENGGKSGVANYNYDAIDVIRQAMVDYAAELLPLINAARNAGNTTEYTRLYTLYLDLMLDLDEMLSYDENFKLERWTSLARNIADEVSGTTENDRNWLEWNARTQVTVWSKGNTDLHDYSNRCWAGLIKDFHYWRWKYFFENNGNAPSGGWFSGFEYPWTVDFNGVYSFAGDYSQIVIPTDMSATAKAVETFGNYFGRVKGATKNYIFPMGVATNATKSDVIPEVYRGQTVELPLIIGKEVTVSSVQIDLNGDGAMGTGETLAATDMNVAIPADAAIGKTKAIVTFSDGTVITFNLAIIVDITADRTVTAATADANMGTVAIEGTSELTITNQEAVKITATANTGYNFKNWTDGNGNVVSNDNPYIYYGETDATFTANFIQDKWGVVECNGTLSGDIASHAQFIHNLTFAYYNREAETIFEATAAPTQIFNTVPQIINVPQGASFTVKYDNGDKDGLKYCYFRAFIDLNADGDFDDEGELLKEVGTNGATNAAVCSNTMNVLLPYDMPLGITHMRLRFDGAWDNGNNPSGRGAKDASIRPVYEIILNITDKSDKAAHITVKSNNNDWGTAEVWTDETPDGSTGSEWDVSSNIPLYLRATKASEDVEFLGWYDHYDRLLTTELEYTMYAREDATYTAKFRKFLEIDGWQIEYRTEGKNVILTKVRQSGNNDLVIPETVNVLGEELTIAGFDNNLFNGNKDLWSITMPKTMEFLSITSLISGTMTGTVASGTGTVNSQYYTIYNLDEALVASEGFEVTVKGTSDGSTYNQWGSGLFASGTDPLATTYNGGFQFYLGAAGNFVLKVNGSAEEALNNSNCKVIANTPFTATIRYQNGTLTIAVDNGEGQTGTYTKACSINNISAFSAAIPKGITLNVNVKSLLTKEANPFEGCSNLDAIAFNGECTNYYVDANGDLYNSSGYLVCSPAGKAKGADRRALGALIEQMEALTNSVASYNPTGTAIELPLQTTEGQPYYIFCNNPETSEGQGVAGLLDENNSTYLHSNWHNVSSSNDYLQIELGTGNELEMFKIAGVQRSGASADFPKTIEVLGSTDKQTWDKIATVTGLPQNAGSAWESEVIAPLKKYAYLRFVVTTGSNRIYFHMAKFDLYKVSASADVYTYLEGGITNEQAAAAYNAMVKAIKVYDNGTTAEEMQAAKNELQTAYEALDALLKAALPITLTTDEENPVLYKIFIKRTADVTVLKYDEATKQVAVANTADNSSWQAWYFTGSANGVRIHPYNADGNVLAADATGNAVAAVWAAAKGEKNFDEWKFVSRTDGYYNIQARDGSNYFSNNGGTGNKMGFWNGSPDSDTGSLFKFVKAEFAGNNPRYYQLSDLKSTLIDGTNIYGGTGVGLYTGGKEYREAYTVAAALVTAGNASDATDCHNAYKTLRATNKALKYNAPDPSKFYTIKSVATNGYCAGKYVQTLYQSTTRTRGNYTGTHDHNHLIFDYTNKADIQQLALAVFQFEETGTQGEYKMKNLHTGLYVKAFADTHMGTEAEAQTIKIAGFADGQVTLKIGDNAPMHAQQDYGVIVQWNAAANNASLWTIDEATDINHLVNISSVGYSTLFLNYPVAIPDGVAAYTANEIIDDKWLNMQEITSGVIPAKTAVVLKGDAGIYNFELSNEPRTVVEDIFTGTLYKQTITKESGKYYVLANIDTTPDDGEDNKEVGFYNAVSGDNTEEFINAANKAYLHIPEASKTVFYGFRFEDGETTGIGELQGENSNNKGIYDLQGRKVEKPERGIYIIDGKKQFVK
ncbi:MAG: alpha-N-acetylglucosaminidase C-terminal domain-containing protein, partial [Bacteroidaceae bacterium]|nr:alpha-N-acetylglucosaminidase C-terminal domain-containing protein [Bacteroidaceae bacterium]